MKCLLFYIASLSIMTLPAIAQDTDPTPPPTLTDATSIKVRVYKIAISTAADCSSPSTIFESAGGIEADLLSKPTFAKGKIPEGTYRCVIVELSKRINTTGPAACTTPQNNLICSDAQESRVIGSGSNLTCSGGVGNDQKVAAYFTTLSSASSGSRVLLPPLNGSDTTSGLALGTPITFPAKRKATLKLKKAILNNDCTAAIPDISISVE